MSFSEYSADDFDAEFMRSFPNKIPDIKFYKGVEELSPSFVKIYKEALSAEILNLTEVAGAGYRRAFEFLVKDYAITNNPNNRKNIEEMPLDACVKIYIKHPTTLELSKRTVWLGNDQTHYINKHTDMGIKDLKNLLDLSVEYITMELKSKEARKIPYVK